MRFNIAPPVATDVHVVTADRFADRFEGRDADVGPDRGKAVAAISALMFFSIQSELILNLRKLVMRRAHLWNSICMDFRARHLIYKRFARLIR